MASIDVFLVKIRLECTEYACSFLSRTLETLPDKRGYSQSSGWPRHDIETPNWHMKHFLVTIGLKLVLIDMFLMVIFQFSSLRTPYKSAECLHRDMAEHHCNTF